MILSNYLIVTLHISSKLNNCNDQYINTYLYLVILIITSNNNKYNLRPYHK